MQGTRQYISDLPSCSTRDSARAGREASVNRFGACLLTFAILALVGLFFSQPAYSEGRSAFEEGPDGDLFRRKAERARAEIDSLFSTGSFAPLHNAWAPIDAKLDEHDLEVAFQYNAIVQHGSDLIPGIEDVIPGAQKTLSGGDFDVAVKWHAFKRGEPWAGYFRVSGEHRHPYTDLYPAAMAEQIGSLWLTARGWTEYDHFAVTEFYWHQGTFDSPFEYRIGRVKNTTIWNGGKFIGGSTRMNGGQITGTPAMVNLAAGWSATAVYHPYGDTAHIMAGVFQANGDNESLQPLRLDELIYGFQAGVRPEFMGYKGRYHIFAWHVDESERGSEANGFAVNAEHTFGNWTPWFRYSFGDQESSDPKPPPIRQSANIGIGYEGVFGQNKDWAAIGVAWAEPTDRTLRDQYGLEFDYSFRLFPNVILTPHFQLIRNPSKNPSKDHLTVLGLRARLEF